MAEPAFADTTRSIEQSAEVSTGTSRSATIAAAHAASFRDPGGFMFWGEDGELYRQVNARCSADYGLLMESGLYQQLSGRGLLVEHVA